MLWGALSLIALPVYRFCIANFAGNKTARN
jgi:hypothetical protein